MDLKDIKAIIDLMKKNSISEFELERGQEFKIKLKRGGAGPVQIIQPEESPTAFFQPASHASVPQVTTPAAALSSGEAEIKSPMIGTFYRSPSPESAPYVEVGSEVNPDTVVALIEAMKVMNEIKAEVKGIITQVIVDNAKPVEFGQPMFKIRPL